MDGDKPRCLIQHRQVNVMKKRLISYFLVVLTIITALIFPSCSEAPDDVSETGGYSIDAAQLLNYRIVRPDTAEGDAVQCGIDVRSAFVDAGYTLKLTTDFYREDRPEYSIGEYEILVGKTNRPETAEFLDHIQMWQYGYALIGEKIVIAGHDEASTRLAVDEFKKLIASRTPFSFTTADDYLYGEVKEGEGSIYSVLTLDAGELSVSAIIDKTKEYSPDVLMLYNAAPGVNASLTESADMKNYVSGADFCIEDKHSLTFYNKETFTYSSADTLEMSKLSFLSKSERGAFTYCVLRSAETKKKMVFCLTDLSGIDETDVKNRLSVFTDFADNCGKMQVFLSGEYDGSAGSSACSVLTDAGFADLMRLSSDSSGEGGIYTYANYNRTAGVECVKFDSGCYTSFQKAK